MANAAHNGSQSFKVKYAKTATFQFIGAELPAGFCDFSKAQKLQVWVYGKVTLLLKLEDKNLKSTDVSEQQATNPSGWTLLIFSYKSAGNTINLDEIRSMLLFPAPGISPVSGEFYLDDIALYP